MLNVKNDLCSFLLEKDDCPFSEVMTDLFSANDDGSIADKNEILCRYEPSEGSVKSYIDGSRKVRQVFSFYSRNKNSVDARNFLQWILDNAADKSFTIKKNGFPSVEINVEDVTLPQFVSADDRGFTTYMLTVYVSFTEG